MMLSVTLLECGFGGINLLLGRGLYQFITDKAVMSSLCLLCS
jgi:hypothetical protein